MGVKVRYQTNKDGGETIWLDCYYKGKRTSVWPDLHIPKGTGKRLREEIVQKATAVADRTWQEILETGRLDRLSPNRMDFVEYFEKTMNEKKKNRQWNSVLRLLRLYAITYEYGTITLDQAADRDWHESFKNFLLEEAEILQPTAQLLSRS